MTTPTSDEVLSELMDWRDNKSGVSLGGIDKAVEPPKGYAVFQLTTDTIEQQAPEIEQSLDELARRETRRMILAALEMEVEQYVQALRHLRDEQGVLAEKHIRSTSVCNALLCGRIPASRP